MPEMRTHCPNCRVGLRLTGVPPVGTDVQCPKCGKAIALAPARAVDPSKASLDGKFAIAIDPVPPAIPVQTKTRFPFLRPAERPDELGRLGHFRVLKELGRGGMGIVFFAEDVQLLRNVALKVLLPQHAARKEARARFLREARTAAKIENDHIIAIHEVGEDRGMPYLSMPLLKGEGLAERMERDGRLPLPEVLRIAWQICDGLQAAHSRGLVHRDLKPANVWLESPSGSQPAAGLARVKILDFGLARAVNTEQQFTRTGVVLSTPSYMAPEQTRDPNVDARADLFSLGVMLFQMTTGKLPFSGPNALSVLFAITNDMPPTPRSLNADVPPELSDLIMKLLEKAPEHRFATAHHVAAALEAIDARSFAGQAIHSGVRTIVQHPTQEEIAAKLFAFDTAPGKLVSLTSMMTGQTPAASSAARRPISWKWLTVGAAALVGILIAAQVVIRIRNRDGSETKIEAPKGSTVTVEKNGKPILKMPSDKPKAKAPVADPHRRLAEMILDQGGSLAVRTLKGQIEITKIQDLPPEPFLVVNVKGGDSPIPDEVLQAFEGVYYVPTISLTLDDTAGLHHLRGVCVWSITLKGQDLNGDECLRLLGDRPDLHALVLSSSSVSDVSVPLLLKMKVCGSWIYQAAK